MAKLLGGTQVYGNATINSYLVVSGNADLSGGNVSIGSGNTTVTSITITATGNSYQASPTVTVSAPTTLYGANATANVSLGVVAIAANIGGGTGYAVNNILTAVGNAGVISNATFIVNSVSGGVITGLSVYNNAGTYYWANTQPLTFTGGAGTGANAFVYYGLNTPTMTYNGVGYTEPATVTFSGGSPAVNGTGYPLIGGTANIRALANTLDFYAPNNISLLRLQGQNGASGYATNGTTPALTILAPQSNYGTTVINSSSQLYIVSRTAGGTISLQTSGADPVNSTGSGVTQFAVSGTPSAVNYVQVTGAVTGGAPTISAQGSDSNIHLSLNGKGTGGVRTQFYHTMGYSYNNYITLSGQTTGNAPTIIAGGSDTNVDLSVKAQGTGNVTTASPLTVTNANVSTSVGTGALIVAGGAGIAGNLSIGGNIGIGTAPSIYTLDILDTNPNSGTGLRVIGGNVGYPIATFTRQGTNSSIVIQHGSANPGMYYTKTGTTYVSHGYDGTYFKLSNAAQIGTNDLLLVTQSNGNIVITSTTTSTSTTTGALVVTGGAGIVGDVNIGANLTYGTVPILESSRTVAGIGTAPVAIDWFASTAYRTAKYVVSTTDVTNSWYQSIEIISVQDGTTSTISTYGLVSSTANACMTFSSNIVSGNVILWGTGVSANNTVKLVRTLIPA